MALKKSLEKETEGWTSYMKALDGYMHEKNLDIEGVLTTFKTDKKGKHKRELLILVRSGGSIKTSEEAKRVRDELIEGLEASGELLDLEVWGEKKSEKLSKKAQEGEDLLDSGLGGRWGKVWLQGNDKATRKQVAPLLVSLPALASNIADLAERCGCQTRIDAINDILCKELCKGYDECL
jgi:exopolyphosphatase